MKLSELVSLICKDNVEITIKDNCYTITGCFADETDEEILEILPKKKASKVAIKKQLDKEEVKELLDQGKTQKQIAEIFGVGQSAISRLLTGQQKDKARMAEIKSLEEQHKKMVEEKQKLNIYN